MDGSAKTAPRRRARARRASRRRLRPARRPRRRSHAGRQRELDGERLAARAPAVRLQRVAEPAVGVAVGGDRVPDGRGPPPANSRSNRRRSSTRAFAARYCAAASMSGLVMRPTAARHRPAPSCTKRTAGARLVPWTGRRATGSARAPARSGRLVWQCLWVWVVPPDGGQATLVLPDACSDLIWQSGRGAFVAGPTPGPGPRRCRPGRSWRGRGSGRVRAAPPSACRCPPCSTSGWRRPTRDRLRRPAGPAAGARARPGGGAAAAGQRGALTWCSTARRTGLVTEAARLLGRPRAQAGDVAARLGVGERQLLRRCRAAVGYGPATLRRVLRFRRFVARIDAGQGAGGRIWPGWPPTPATPIRRT